MLYYAASEGNGSPTAESRKRKETNMTLETIAYENSLGGRPETDEVVAYSIYREGDDETPIATVDTEEEAREYVGFLHVGKTHIVRETGRIIDTPDGKPTEKDVADKIKAVLRRYFERDDGGRPNPDYDETFEAQSAIDEIHGIVGNI